MITTTLSTIRSHKPCASGWKTLLGALGPDYGDDTPIPLARIVETNSVADALWALRCVPDGKRIEVQFAIECAEHVLSIFETKYPQDNRPRAAIAAAKAWLANPCRETQNAADAAAYAADAAAYNANAAASAAYADAAASAAEYAARASANAAYAAAVSDAAYAAYAAADAAANVAAERAWQKARLIDLLNGG